MVKKDNIHENDELIKKINSQKPIFAYSNCDSEYMPNNKKTSKAALKLSRLLIYGIIAIMLCLYCYSIYFHIKHKLGLGGVLGAAFPIGVCCLILILSAHNAWGKLAGFALSHKSLQSREFKRNKANIEDVAKAEVLDKLREFDDAFYIYDDMIVFKTFKDYDKINIEDLTSVEITKLNYDFKVKFLSKNGKITKFDDSIPNQFINELRACFECKVNIQDMKYDTAQQKERTENFKQKLPAALFTLIFIFAGIGLVIANKYSAKIPLFLGIFFIYGGTLAFCGAIGSSSEIMKKVVIPCLFSGMFLVFPIGLMSFLMKKGKIGNPFLLFAYAPITIVLVMFVLLGLFGGITALYKMFKIIKR